MTRWLTCILLAAALAGGAVFAQEQEPPGEELATAEVVPVAVVTSEGVRTLAPGDAVYPGETLLLRVDWPEGLRPDHPVLILGEKPLAPGTPLPRRLIPGDRRVDGEDLLEVLVTALGETEIPETLLGERNGTVLSRTLPLPMTIDPRTDSQSEEPAPIRPPVTIPIDRVPLVLIAALLVALVAGTWWSAIRLRKKIQDRPAPVKQVVRIPPSIRALDAIEALLAEGLLERNLVKPFSVRIAEIGKGYLGEVMDVPLLESTSRECLRLLRGSDLAPKRLHWLSSWLERLDMIKFAEDRPATLELRECAEDLKQLIVEMTAEAEAAVAGEPNRGLGSDFGSDFGSDPGREEGR